MSERTLKRTTRCVIWLAACILFVLTMWQITTPKANAQGGPIPCLITGSFSAAGNSTVLDNRVSGCYQWRAVYASTGFSAVSVEIDEAPDSGGSPGTWAAFTGAAITDGSNPSTSTNAATIGVHSAAAWVRLKLASKVGTGLIYYQVWGANSVSTQQELALLTVTGVSPIDVTCTTLSCAVSASYQGNGAKVQASTGTTTSGHCVEFDSNGNTVDSGSACGSGAVTAVSASAPLTSSGGATPNISASYQGNGAMVQASTGTTTSGHCVEFDSNGNTVDSGSACGSGGSGALTRLSQTVVSTPVSSVTFSSISGSYSNLLLEFSCACSAAAVSEAMEAVLNSDTTTGHYGYNSILSSGTASLSAAVGTAAFLFVSNATCANAVANASTVGTLRIPNYSGTTFLKSAYSVAAVPQGTTFNSVILNMSNSGWWNSTAAITSIMLQPASGNFVTGSIFTLYGEQ